MASTKFKQGSNPSAKAIQGPRLSIRSKKGGTSFWSRVWAQRELLLMVLPYLVWFAIFRYGPIYGLRVSFQKYSPFLRGDSPWVGLQHFERFFGQKEFWELVSNTLTLSITGFIISFPCNIVFALILNEIRQTKWKKAYQTISYLPNFLSGVVVISLFRQMLSPTTGFVNVILGWFGVDPIHFIMEKDWYYAIYIGSGLWAGLGSGAIIYLSALAGVDTQLYEAAEIDGCSRLKRIIHITLPSILPTIVIMFLLAIGGITNVGVDKSLLLMEPATYEVSDVLSTYIYRVGLVEGGNVSYSSAIGFVQSVVSFILVLTFNKLSAIFTETSFF